MNSPQPFAISMQTPPGGCTGVSGSGATITTTTITATISPVRPVVFA